LLVKSSDAPQVTKEFNAMLCWLSEQPLDTARKYLIKQTTRIVKTVISRIDYRVDVNTMDRETVSSLKMNDIAHVGIKVQLPLVCDDYARNHATGSFIIIDESSNNTVAAGMISVSGN